jgi:hypothetical protein
LNGLRRIIDLARILAQRGPVSVDHLLHDKGCRDARQVGSARRSCQEQGQSDEIVGRISDDGLIKIADLNGNPSVRRSDRA